MTFYKKTTLQFIKAISQKSAQKSYEEFKKYVDALRTIQSADADALIAQAEKLQAEQELIAELSSGLPVVGDAIDIVALATGKDLTGRELSSFEAGLTLVSLVAPDLIIQAIKRNPAIAESLGKLMAAVSGAPKKTITKLSKTRKEALQYLDELSKKTPSEEVLKWRDFYYQKIREANKLASLDKAARDKLIKISQEKLEKTLRRDNPLGDTMGDKIADVANDLDEVIVTRPTSPDLADRLAEGAYTKGMNVKGKSADSGIASGYVPAKQKFSKMTDPEEIAKFQRKVDESLQTTDVIVDGKKYTITPQMVGKKQLVVTRGGMELKGVEIFKKGSTESIAVFKSADGRLLDENLVEISEDLLKKYDVDKAIPFEILTDMKGNGLAADIDLAMVGSKKGNKILQNDGLMGNIDANEMGTVAAINKGLKSDAYPDRNLVHHGGENSFMNKDSVPDFPMVGYVPNGAKSVIQNVEEFKEFVHLQKLKGYTIDPNPYWGWGEWDPLHGYK
ncbi:MAG: hypothetical protein COB42_00265 [Sulfurimonas sp.]|nr:MAG: hypothetical protein COB42_00265 [Sulfurimonas sp.]